MHDRMRVARSGIVSLLVFSRSFWTNRVAVAATLTLFAIIPGGLGASAWAANAPDHGDPYEVEGPERAAPTRWDLSPAAREAAVRRAVAAGHSRGDVLDAPRVAALLADVSRWGLDDLAVPRHRSVSLGLARSAALVDPAAASLEIAATHPALVGVGAEDLALVDVRQGAGMSYVHFRQLVDGLPILGSHVVFQWDDRGRLRLAGSDVYTADPLDLDARVSRPAPDWISLTDARLAALDGLPTEVEVTEWEFAEQAWLPLVVRESNYGFSGPAPRFSLAPVWNVRFLSEEPLGRYDVLVDGESGVILSRENRIHFEEFHGTVVGGVEPNQPGDDPSLLGMPAANYFLRGVAPRFGTTTSDGSFSLDAPAGDYTFITALAGRHIFVLDALAGFGVPTDSVSAEVGAASGPLDFTWDDTNSSPSERDVYYHATRAYEAIRTLDPGPGLAELDTPMPAVVDDPTGTCNAYWNGTRINFYADGGGCVATGRIADVVYHEYAHAITQFTWGFFQPSGAMHEGFSDYFAATLRDDPVIGRGFFGPGSSLRNIEIDRVYPEDIVGEVHIDGLIIAGALWDLRKDLGAEITDHLWHYAGYGGSTTFDDYLLDLIVLDDDDADLGNGTPHLEAIVRNFRAHGIGQYAADLSQAILPDVEVSGSTIAVSARVFSLVPIGTGGAVLFYSTDGGSTFLRAELMRGVVAGTWVTQIPTPPAGTTVQYYWSFTNQLGDVTVAPANAPAEVYSFYVGKDEIAPLIVHVEPTAVAINAERVHLRAQIADNSQRLGDVRVEMRVGNGPLFEVPMVVREIRGLGQPVGVGTYAYGPFLEYEATLDLPDLTGVGALEYRVLADDQASERNTGSAPLDGFFEVPVRRGWGGDFETEPGPLEATGEWEWGEAGPGYAWSGTHVWATNVDGPYPDNMTSYLTLGPFDLGGYERARFEFRHRYRFEQAYDGGDIQIRVGAEGIWGSAMPEGGYPERHVDALDGPGYSGDSGEWERILVPLDFYLGDEIWIRLRAASDVGITDLGWYIDDLALLEAQAHIDPKDLTATEGLDERVELTWRAPTGVNTSTGRWLGFHVYRRELGTERDVEVRLTPEPIRVLNWVDTADLVNGKTYVYRITSLHDDGESRGAEIQGRPFAASVSVDAAALGLVVSDYAAASRTLGVRNQGSGFLEYDIVLTDPGVSAAEATASYEVTGIPGELPTLVLADPPGGDDVVDVTGLSVLEMSVGETPMFRFQLDGAWTNPRTDWGGMLVFDVDGNLDTSQGDFGLPWGGMVNMGFEYGIIFGNVPAQVGFPDPSVVALFFDAARTFLVPVPFAVLESDAPITFDVPAAWLGGASGLRMQLVTGARLDLPASDYLPDLPAAAAHFRRSPRHGFVGGNATDQIQVVFEAPHLPSGTYRADLLVLSNDRSEPELRVPVTVQVDRTTAPPTLLYQSLTPAVTGMEIRFAPSPALAATSVGVEREEADGSWRRLDRTPLLPDEDGVYFFRDRFVRAATNYRYRIPVAFAGGASRTYGPFEAIFSPDGEPQVFPQELPALAVGSSSEGMLVSFTVPEVFDPLVGVWLDRRMLGEEEFVALLEEPLLPAENREVRYLDPWASPFNDGIVPEEEYEYRIRIELADDEVVYFQGGRFTPPVPTELRLLAPRPNPFRDQVVLRFDLPAALPARLEVFDVSGRRRAVLAEGEWIAGTHQIVWNGDDADGDPLGSGVYWMRLETPVGTETLRLLRMR